MNIQIAEFELDSNELDEEAQQALERHIPHSDHDQRMPLLVGLFDSSASQRSLDASIQMRTGNGTSVIVGEDTIDLDELAAKRTAGGGLLDSIANMANSILGAGAFLHTFLQTSFRNSAVFQVLLV
jgi:sodium-coupled neutral amino acid transporter 11